MNGATDYDIAACLRRSSTALVKWYAHLSPNHLKHVMEGVARFGKAIGETTRPEESHLVQISSPTVTGTKRGGEKRAAES